MTFEIEINGRVRSVTIDRTAGDRYSVVLDGVTHDVDAVRLGRYGVSLIVDGAASRAISVAPGSLPGESLVGLDGKVVPAIVNGRRTGRGAGDAGGHADGEASIAAPMPGRVVRVLVSPGDEVHARQAVVVIEAMKMENELRSPKAGRVKEVAVAAGTSVEAGRVLVLVE